MLRTAPGMRKLNSVWRETRPEDLRQIHFLNQLSYWLGEIFKSKKLKGGGRTMDENNQKPVFKCKFGAFETAIFLQEIDGRSVPSIAIQKSFTKDGNNWNHQKMTLLSPVEADKLICALQETKKALYLKDFQ
jgi:hypothetical protein